MNPINDNNKNEKQKIAVVIPAYRVEREIENVIRSLPSNIQHIIVVDDGSPDRTRGIVELLAKDEPRLVLIHHASNQGVGGAMISGFRKALELDVGIVIKMDGDGQMAPNYIPDLLGPILQGKADFTQGNRFRDFVALRQMPIIRRLGNITLSFLSKFATGYWNIFDPTNGFFAIRADVLAQIPLERIARTYYFEISLLAELYLIDAYIMDVPISASYGNQGSSLLVQRVLFEFPHRLLMTFVQRMALKNFLYDFSMISVYLLSGISLFLIGFIYGLIEWIKFASMSISAPTGTVILPTMCIILGIQFLLSAIQIDLQSVPNVPLFPSLKNYF